MASNLLYEFVSITDKTRTKSKASTITKSGKKDLSHHIKDQERVIKFPIINYLYYITVKSSSNFSM